MVLSVPILKHFRIKFQSTHPFLVSCLLNFFKMVTNTCSKFSFLKAQISTIYYVHVLKGKYLKVEYRRKVAYVLEG